MVDSSFFTALQLQPGLVLAQSWKSLAAWCRDHLVPYPQLVGEHGVGAVVLAVEMRYPQRLCFFDSDTLTVRTRLGLRRRGTRLEQHTTITAAGRTAATVRTVLCPVVIREPISLTAEPAPPPDALAHRFRDDEVDPSAPERTLPALLDAVRAATVVLAEPGAPWRRWGRTLVWLGYTADELALPLTLSLQQSTVKQLLRAGRPDLEHRYVLPVMRGERTGSFCWSEGAATVRLPNGRGAGSRRLCPLRAEEPGHHGCVGRLLPRVRARSDP